MDRGPGGPSRLDFAFPAHDGDPFLHAGQAQPATDAMRHRLGLEATPVVFDQQGYFTAAVKDHNAAPCRLGMAKYIGHRFLRYPVQGDFHFARQTRLVSRRCVLVVDGDVRVAGHFLDMAGQGGIKSVIIKDRRVHPPRQAPDLIDNASNAPRQVVAVRGRQAAARAVRLYRQQQREQGLSQLVVQFARDIPTFVFLSVDNFPDQGLSCLLPLRHLSLEPLQTFSRFVKRSGQSSDFILEPVKSNCESESA